MEPGSVCRFHDHIIGTFNILGFFNESPLFVTDITGEYKFLRYSVLGYP